jgi:hypothetical protein
MRSASFCISVSILCAMAKAITLRLDEADHEALTRQADELRVRPGTLARMLVHAGLEGGVTPAAVSSPRAAIERLIERSRARPAADAVALVEDARAGLGGRV